VEPFVVVEPVAGRIGVQGNSSAAVGDSLVAGVGIGVAGVGIGAAGVDKLRIEVRVDIEAVRRSLCFQWVGMEVAQAGQDSLGLRWELLGVDRQAGLPEEESHYRAVGLAGLVEVGWQVENSDCMEHKQVVDLVEGFETGLLGLVEVGWQVENSDCMEHKQVVDLVEGYKAGLLEEEWDCMQRRQVADPAVERTGWCQIGKQRPWCLAKKPNRQSLHQLELEQPV
jgi:hypothetical protein